MATPSASITDGAGPGSQAEALRELLLARLAMRPHDQEGASDPAERPGQDPGAETGEALFWARRPPPARKPRVSRADLAGAAVRLADTDGLNALSMRRLAAELGVGTMTLYHYVETKNEVLALALDTAMAEIIFGPGELPDGWRGAMTSIARRTRDVYRRHPWMVDLHGSVPYGPSTVLHYDQSLQAVRDLDAPLEAKLDVVSTTDEFVFGFCLAERSGLIQERTPHLLDYLAVLFETGAYPELSRLVDEHGLEHLWDRLRAHDRDDSRFDRNLARVLDGLASSLDIGGDGTP